MKIKAYFSSGRLVKIALDGQEITNIKYHQMYDANYWRFQHGGSTYRLSLGRLLLVDHEIYIPANIDGSEHSRDGKWSETITYRKVGEIIEFPEVWRMIRDDRLGDLVEYGVKVIINGKEIFDDLGRPWRERYARVFKVVAQEITGNKSSIIIA